MAGTSDTSTTHLGQAAAADETPAVVNVRRPRAAAVDSQPALQAARSAVLDNAMLPPTVLRLPNLATLGRLRSGMSILSIVHWIGLALGAVIALWLIFGGRGGPKPTGEDAPAAPARAEAGSQPAWNPPPLATAGDSEAPAWKPPTTVAAPAAEAGATAPPPNSAPPVETAPVDTAPAEPNYESWPKADRPATPPERQDTQPELPGWDDSGALSTSNAADGPVARTAQREAIRSVTRETEAPEGDAESLGITVSVPQ